MTDTTDLVAFLRARLDEDEEVAQATRKNEQFVYGTGRWFASHNNAITSMAPHRSVAEVEAKRQIIELHQPDRKLPDDWYGNDATCKECGHLWHLIRGSSLPSIPRGCRTLRLLALPYDRHPDYRLEWAPDVAAPPQHP